MLVDQLLKLFALHALTAQVPVSVFGSWVQLTLVRNAGAAFSLGSSATWIFALLGLAVVAIILWWAPGAPSRPWRVAVGLFLGGVCGNLADRLFRPPALLRGAVIDYIQVRGFSIFNFADVCITISVIFMLFLLIRGVRPGGELSSDDAVHEHPGH